MAERKFIKRKTLTGVQLQYKNFRAKPYDERSQPKIQFGALLDEETALEMMDEGWTIKTIAPRKEGDDFKYYIIVTIKFHDDPEDGRNPQVYRITEGTKTMLPLNQKSIKCLDRDDVLYADIAITPYVGDTWVAAYLYEGYFTVARGLRNEQYGDFEVLDINE